MINLGIIGGGAVVKTHHWPALRKLRKQIRVIALARRDTTQARAFATEAGIPHVYNDYRQLLRDPQVDAVLTAVPIMLNGAVLMDAIRAGKHVLAEKPVAATPQHGQRIVKESARRRQVVLIGENFRYRRDIIKAGSLIQAGLIGKVFAFQLLVKFDLAAEARRLWVSRGWRKEARHPGGFILDAGVHPVAALRYVLGEVDMVFAAVLDTSDMIGGPDSLLMQVCMASGVAGQCFFCYTAKEELEIPFDFSIFGTAGALRLVRGEITHSRGVGVAPKIFEVPEVDGGYLQQWKNFCAAIRGETSVVYAPADGLRDLMVIDAALRSSASGRSVHIPVTPGKPLTKSARNSTR